MPIILQKKHLYYACGAKEKDRLQVMSSCVVRPARAADGSLISLYIEIGGELSKIPASKNSRITNTQTGRSFPNPQKKRRLEALTGLIKPHLLPTDRFPEGADIMLLCYFSNACGRGDTDNAKSTIKDWFEPPKKMRGGRCLDRGWGLGVVQEDNKIVGLDDRSRVLPSLMAPDKTYIMASVVTPQLRRFQEAFTASMGLLDMTPGQRCWLEDMKERVL